jgi:LPS-assembly protein
VKEKVVLILVLVFGIGLPLQAAVFDSPLPDSQVETPIVVNGDSVDYQAEEKLITAEGNVKVSYKDVIAFADKAEVNIDTSVAYLVGNVRIEHEGGILYGENIVYDFEKKTAEIKEIFFEDEPFYVSAEKAQRVSGERYELDQACFTTCGPLDQPRKFFDYKIKAKTVELYPGDKIVAKNVFFQVGDVPVLYLPYYMQPAKDKLPRVTIIPGSDSDLGFFVLSAWRYYFDESFRGRLHVDYYNKKGLGYGITHKYDTQSLGEGIAKLYYISDRDGLSFDNSDPVEVGSDRYKVQLRHNWQMRPSLKTKLELHKFSDNYFMKDYFNREYERDKQPDSYLLTTYSMPYSSLSLLAQKRVNRFYDQTEYLPSLQLDIFRNKIGNTNFYFDATYSLANLTYKRSSPSSEDDDTVRFDAYNQLTYQKRFGWLNISPYAGLRRTYYSKDEAGREDILRGIFYSGIDLSTKFYKTFPYPLNFFGIKADKTRHIVTPTLEYSYIRSPTVHKDKLMQFDSIDEIERESKMTFTLVNKFQAKREDWTWDLLRIAPALSYLFNEEEKGSHLSLFENDIEFRPAKNLYLTQNYKYDLDKEETQESTSDIIWKSFALELSLGHRYVKTSDASEITSSFSYRFAPKWKFTNRLRYDEKDNKFSEQEYFFQRELNCWYVDFGLSVNRDYDKTVWVIFRIKAFPEIGVNLHGTYASPDK